MFYISEFISFFAAFSSFYILLRDTIHELIPESVSTYIESSFIYNLLSTHLTKFTFVIEDDHWNGDNFRAVHAYLPTRIGPLVQKLLILGSYDKTNNMTQCGIPLGANVVDEFEGMRLKWSLKSRKENEYHHPVKFFTLTCNRNSREKVMKKYLPHVFSTAQDIMKERKVLNIYSFDHKERQEWIGNVFNHPSTFETLAMEPDLKKFILDDIDLFVKRKDFFRGVGRAWKRGYLLYGPPGTGKSSLVAAIANHLRYHVYDMQFSSIKSDLELRNILTMTCNRSILLVEDIDCNTQVVRKRASTDGNDDDDNYDNEHLVAIAKQADALARKENKGSGSGIGISEVSLSGLLNFVDGLWSTCGDERIIIFTTNHKDKLDPALLRPGRMDAHIYMGYCTPTIFRSLAYNYIRIEEHELFTKIEQVIETTEVTPAEVAGQLMNSSNPEYALQCLIHFLINKNKEATEGKDLSKKSDTQRVTEKSQRHSITKMLRKMRFRKRNKP